MPVQIPVDPVIAGPPLRQPQHGPVEHPGSAQIVDGYGHMNPRTRTHAAHPARPTPPSEPRSTPLPYPPTPLR
ncbi:hypothetical protein L083_4490 [Actinoplanes sp. N902-109]|nr:hypothetical protein L083_4490 [Actinoplanes sp. N902-109]